MQDRTNKVIQILIIEASENTQFLQELLISAMQGAATYAQKYKEMQDVVNLASKINNEIKSMENYYVAQVKGIEDKVTKAKKTWFDTANSQFFTRLNLQAELGIDSDSNYKKLKERLQIRIRTSVVTYLKEKAGASPMELEKVMNEWTLASAIKTNPSTARENLQSRIKASVVSYLETQKTI